jgi:hypothetical protein
MEIRGGEKRVMGVGRENFLNTYYSRVIRFVANIIA